MKRSQKRAPDTKKERKTTEKADDLEKRMRGAQVQRIPLDKIRVPENRKRPVTNVDDLMESFVAVGQLQPIIVDESFTLISGGNRFETARRLGWESIDGIVVRVRDLERELIEIDENLIRKELTPLQRCTQLARRKEIFELLHPDKKHGGAPGVAGGGKRRTEAPGSGSFVEQVAAQTGRGRSTVAEDVAIGKKLNPAIVERLRDHHVGRSKDQLRRLAALSEKEQLEVAEQLQTGDLQEVPTSSSNEPPHSASGRTNQFSHGPRGRSARTSGPPADGDAERRDADARLNTHAHEPTSSANASSAFDEGEAARIAIQHLNEAATQLRSVDAARREHDVASEDPIFSVLPLAIEVIADLVKSIETRCVSLERCERCGANPKQDCPDCRGLGWLSRGRIPVSTPAASPGTSNSGNSNGGDGLDQDRE